MMTPPDDKLETATDREDKDEDVSNPFVALVAPALLIVPFLLGFLSLRRSRAAHEGIRGSLGILRPPGSLGESMLIRGLLQ